MTDLLETFCVGVAIGAGTVGFAWWAFTAAHRRDRQNRLRQQFLRDWPEEGK